MNAHGYALSLMAEAAAHGIEILFNHREIGLSTRRSSWEPFPTELLEDLDTHANEIWAILHGYRAPISEATS
ncbi:hypothetical protein IWX78_001334 [Mycetocola sp. CAN_C7]|uniref:hypothetical protein n=1 Tax=Mycetocola sp. CAN_C7 TaxID=2787724 RepID=UPI0018C8E0AC